MMPASSAVKPPIDGDDVLRVGRDGMNSGVQRATMYTPAVTIVAAWISALTGVGPSIASGSQTCSGNWALLPQAPSISSRQIAVATPPPTIQLGIGQPRLAQHAGHCRRRVVKVERAVGRPDQEQPEGEAEVADAIDQERLLAGRGRRGLFVPEADQQIAAQADRFPKHVEQHEVADRDQHRHREDEQRRCRRRTASSRGRRACSRWRRSPPACEMNVTIESMIAVSGSARSVTSMLKRQRRGSARGRRRRRRRPRPAWR